MVVSGALRIKENERIRKQAALSYAHLEWNIGRLDGWMILKFEYRILTHTCSVCQKYSSIQRCKWVYALPKLTDLHRQIVRKWAWTFPSCFVDLGLPSWIWAFILDLGLHLGFGPRKSPLDFVNFRAPIFCTYSHLYII